MLSSTNSNSINNNDKEGKNNKKSKEKLTNEFINIIGNI